MGTHVPGNPKPIPVRFIVAVAGIVIGIAIGVVTGRKGLNREVLFSAEACWIAIVCFAVSVWDLIVVVGNGQGLQPFWRSRIPLPWIHWCLLMALLLIGLLFGHFAWHHHGGTG